MSTKSKSFHLSITLAMELGYNYDQSRKGINKESYTCSNNVRDLETSKFSRKKARVLALI
jgi:hypothetical protein